MYSSILHSPSNNNNPSRSFLSPDNLPSNFDVSEQEIEKEQNNTFKDAVIDATNVLSNLPTQAELNGLLDQNKQLLHLWKSLQVKSNQMKINLDDTTKRLQLSRWERGTRERMENILKESSRNPNSMIPSLENEFHTVLSSRDVVHIYLIDATHTKLTCRWGSDGKEQITQLSIQNTTTDVVKSYLSGTVLWNNHQQQNNYNYPDQDIDTMAAVVAYIPLIAVSSSNNATTSCKGVAKVMYATGVSIESNITVGCSKNSELGQIGQLCTMIGSFCSRHYDLYAGMENLSIRESNLSLERLEMVNFLRHDWNKMDGMFELKRKLREIVQDYDQNVVSINEAAEEAKNQKEDVTTSTATMRQNIATLVETQLSKLLGKNDSIGLYLPPISSSFTSTSSATTASNSSDSSDSSSSSMALLKLINVTLPQRTQESATMNTYLRGRKYLSMDESHAIVRYVGSTLTLWNSASHALPTTDTSSSSTSSTSTTRLDINELNTVDDSSLLCVPIVTSKCVGVICVRRYPSTTHETSTIDELDQHTVRTYCQHLASFIEEDVLQYDDQKIRKQMTLKNEQIGTIIANELSLKVSMFSSRPEFFNTISSGLSTLLNCTHSYLFVVDDGDQKDQNHQNGRNSSISSVSKSPDNKTIQIKSSTMQHSIINDVLQTSQAVHLNKTECLNNPKCATNIDNVNIQNILCVPLYRHIDLEHKEQKSILTESKSNNIIGLFVLLNKKNFEFNSEDVNIATRAACIVTPLLQGWLQHSIMKEKEQELILQQNDLQQSINMQSMILENVIRNALNVMMQASNAFVFLSSCETACAAVFGANTCTIELLIESNDDDSSQEENDKDEDEEEEDDDDELYTKWTIESSMKSTHPTTKKKLKQSNLTSHDKRILYSSMTKKDSQSTNNICCYKVKGNRTPAPDSGNSSDSMEDTSDNDEKYTTPDCMLKITLQQTNQNQNNNSNDEMGGRGGMDERGDATKTSDLFHLTEMQTQFLTSLKRTCLKIQSKWLREFSASNDFLTDKQEERIKKKQKLHRLNQALPTNPEVMTLAVDALHAILSCETEEELCTVVSNRIKDVVPHGKVALLLPNEPDSNNNMLWSAVPNDSNSTKIQIHVKRDQHPYGITGLALETGENYFISDVTSHTNYKQDSDAHDQLTPSFTSAPDGLGILPNLGQNGSVKSVLQIYQKDKHHHHNHKNSKNSKKKNKKRQRSKTKNKFSTVDKNLWITISNFISTKLLDLKKDEMVDIENINITHEYEQLNKKINYEQHLLHSCLSSMQKIQTNTNSSSILLNVQNELCQAFDFICVGIFVCLDSEPSVVKTAVQNDVTNLTSNTSSNSYMYKVPSTSAMIRDMFATESTKEKTGLPKEKRIIQKLDQLSMLLNELPHISNVPGFVPHDKVALCVPTTVIGGTCWMISVLESDHLNEQIISNVIKLGLPVLNTACSALVTMDLNIKLDTCTNKLQVSETKLNTRDSLSQALLQCRNSTQDLSALLVMIQHQMKNIFQVEALDIFVLDANKNMFWTLDASKNNRNVEQREISIGEGGVLGSLMLSTTSTRTAATRGGASNDDKHPHNTVQGSRIDDHMDAAIMEQSKGHDHNNYISENIHAVDAVHSISSSSSASPDIISIPKYESVCYTSNVRNVFARNECSLDINEPLSVLMVPIITSSGKLIGGINLINRRSGTFTNEDSELSALLAQQIANDITTYQLTSIKEQQLQKSNLLLQEKKNLIDKMKIEIKNITLQQKATFNFISTLSYMRVTNKNLQINRESYYMNVCRSFSACIKNIFHSQSSDLYILDSYASSLSATSTDTMTLIEFNSKGNVAENNNDSISTIVPLVILNQENIFRRNMKEDVNDDTTNSTGGSIESCFAITTNGDGKEKRLIACLHVHHKNTSIEDDDVILYENVIPNILSIISNLLQDSFNMFETHQNMNELSKNADALLIDYEEKSNDFETKELALHVNECCVTVTNVLSKMNEINKEDVHDSIEIMCERVNEILGFDQVVVVYGSNDVNSNYFNQNVNPSIQGLLTTVVRSTIEIDPTLLATKSNPNHPNSRMSIGSRSIISMDTPLLSSSTIQLGQHGPYVLRSSIAPTDPSVLSIDDLKALLGKIVTSGAMLCSFGYEEDDVGSVQTSTSNQNYANNKTAAASSTTKGIVLFLSSEERIDSFNAIELAKYCQLITNSIGFVIEQYTTELITHTELDRLTEKTESLTLETAELTKMNVKQLFELVQANTLVTSLQADVELMETHLQNEINARLQGVAASSLARTLMLWRQSSTQWYMSRWKNNVKKIRRQRYIVLRITSKMHRGIKGHVFFIWKTLIAKELRHRRVLRRCIDAMKLKTLYRCFNTWHERLYLIQSLKHRMKIAVVRIQKRILVHAMNTWIDQMLHFRKGKRAIKHWFLQNLSGHFNRWYTNCNEQKRIRNLTERVVARFSKTTLAHSFNTWLELHVQIRTHRTTLERFTMRWSHLALNRSFLKLVVYSTQRQKMRQKLQTMCDTISRQGMTRIRVMWQHWYLHVHFNKERTGKMQRVCANFLNFQSTRITRTVLFRLKENVKLNNRVRILLTRVTTRLEKNRLHSSFITWYTNGHRLLSKSHLHLLDKASTELLQAQELLAHTQLAHASLGDDVTKHTATMIEMQNELKSSNETVSKQEKELLDMSTISKTMETKCETIEAEKVQQTKQYEIQCMQHKQDMDHYMLQSEEATKTTILEHKKNDKLIQDNQKMQQSLKDTNEKYQQLEIKLQETIQMAREAANQVAMAQANVLKEETDALDSSSFASTNINNFSEGSMFGQNEALQQKSSVQKEMMLRKQVELLVDNAQLEPKAMVHKIAQLVYACNSSLNNDESRVLTKKMLAYMLEIEAMRRQRMESLKSHLEQEMEQKLQVLQTPQLRARRRSSISSSHLKLKSIVSNVLNESYRDQISISKEISEQIKHQVSSMLSSLEETGSFNEIMNSLQDMTSSNPNHRHKLKALKALKTYTMQGGNGSIDSHSVSDSSVENLENKIMANQNKSSVVALMKASVQNLHDGMKQQAAEKDIALREAVKNELAALETELIMADDLQIELYKSSLKNLLDRRNSIKIKKENETLHRALENEMYEGLALLPPDLIELALSELSKIVKNSNEEDDNYNNSINSSNSSSSSELNATQHLQQVRNICLTGNLSMRQQVHSALVGNKSNDSTIILAAFQQADTDGNGSLDVDELNVVIRELGTDLTRKQMCAVFNSIDKDGSGDISFEEFEVWWKTSSDSISIDTKVTIETAVDQYMNDHATDMVIVKSLSDQLEIVTNLVQTSKQNKEQQERNKKEKSKAFVSLIPQLGMEIRKTASTMHDNFQQMHQDLNVLKLNHGHDASFQQALNQTVLQMEQHEKQAHVEVQRSLEETMSVLKNQQQQMSNQSFRRLSVLDHSMRDTSNLVRDEIEKVNADVNELHDMTVKEIHLLSDKARKQLDAISNISEQLKLFEERNNTSKDETALVASNASVAAAVAASSHVMEQALSLSDLRCEKAELKYERAVDHIRHLHGIIHERREGLQNRLSQLVALDTVFLSAEGISKVKVGLPEKVVRAAVRFVEKGGLGGRRRYYSGNGNGRTSGSRRRGVDVDSSKGGELVGEGKRTSGRGTAVVNLWR